MWFRNVLHASCFDIMWPSSVISNQKIFQRMNNSNSNFKQCNEIVFITVKIVFTKEKFNVSDISTVKMC